jgi:hypothetical protein
LSALSSGTIQAFSDDMANDACSSAIPVPLENRIWGCDLGFFEGSGGVLVLVDQAAEDGCAADGVVRDAWDGWWIGLDVGWALRACLMWSVAVVV